MLYCYCCRLRALEQRFWSVWITIGLDIGRIQGKKSLPGCMEELMREIENVLLKNN